MCFQCIFLWFPKKSRKFLRFEKIFSSRFFSIWKKIFSFLNFFYSNSKFCQESKNHTYKTVQAFQRYEKYKIHFFYTEFAKSVQCYVYRPLKRGIVLNSLSDMKNHWILWTPDSRLTKCWHGKPQNSLEFDTNCVG